MSCRSSPLFAGRTSRGSVMPWPFARTIPHDWKRKGFPALPPRGSFNTALHVILFRANAYLVSSA